MVNETYFNQTVRGLYEYFRFKDAPLADTLEVWYQKVKWIPDHAIPMIVEKVQERDTLPRNIPSMIVAIYKSLPGKPKKYDKADFPIQYMWTALEILMARGEQTFNDYCTEVNMPPEDRVRVLAKFKCAYTYSDIEYVASDLGEKNNGIY